MPIILSTNEYSSRQPEGKNCSVAGTTPYTGSPACLAQCPADIANNHCGQHACRQYYYNQYYNSDGTLRDDTYCGWLRQNNYQGYCWPMDEFVCRR